MGGKIAGSGAASVSQRREVIEFLARGPHPSDIVAFRPSAATVARAGELLDKNRENTLTPEERLELNEISAWNRFFSLLKAQARLNFAGVA